MRTVLSALRSFLRFVETKNLTGFYLSRAIPGSSGRKTIVVPTITSEEEQKILGAEDRTTASGKRNYAMFLTCAKNWHEIHRYRQPEN